MIRITPLHFTVAIAAAGLLHAGGLVWASFESDPPDVPAQPEMVFLELAALGDPDGDYQADADVDAEPVRTADPLTPTDELDPLDDSASEPEPPLLDEADLQDQPEPDATERPIEPPDQEELPERFEPPELVQLDDQVAPPPDPELVEIAEPQENREIAQVIDPVLDEVAMVEALTEPPPVDRPAEPEHEVLPEPELTPELAQLEAQDTVTATEVETSLPEPELAPEPKRIELPELVEVAAVAPAMTKPEPIRPPELAEMAPPPMPEPLVVREDTSRDQQIAVTRTAPVRQQVAAVPVPQLDSPPPVVPPAPQQVAAVRPIERAEPRPDRRPEPSVVQPAAAAPPPPARKTAPEKTETAAIVPPKGIAEGSPDRSPNDSFAVYAGELHTLINAKARRTYPRQSIRRGEEGTVPIRIHIDAAGRLLKVEVLDESGASARLVRAAVKAVQSAAPFPAFNGSSDRANGAFDVRISYELR